VSLANQAWPSVSVHEVVAALVRAEREKVVPLLPPQLLTVVDHPNTADASENHLRLRVLYYFRLMMLAEVPPDTEWYRLAHLVDGDLASLLVIGRCGMDGQDDQNELTKAALRLPPQPLRVPPSQWDPPILWGHDKGGPFTILEGNHRLMAYLTGPTPHGLDVPVFVGLSPTPCFWHLPDPARILGNDLFCRNLPPFRW